MLSELYHDHSAEMIAFGGIFGLSLPDGMEGLDILGGDAIE
jgi:hypothetical protein